MRTVTSLVSCLYYYFSDDAHSEVVEIFVGDAGEENSMTVVLRQAPFPKSNNQQILFSIDLYIEWVKSIPQMQSLKGNGVVVEIAMSSP